MTFHNRTLHLFIFILPLALMTFCLSFTGASLAESLSINVQGDLIDLHAQEVPLIDVIKGVCEKAGINLISSDPMTEPVSFEVKQKPVENCLRRLLARRNYALLYETKGDSQLASISLRVLGSGSTVTVEPESPAPPPNDPFKKYEKKSFSQMFQNSKELCRQFSADGVKGKWPDGGGIKLTRVSRESPLAKIGLREGDVVRDVNGRPVKSTVELIEAIQNPAYDPSSIRIERLRENGEMEPIYIELH